MAPKTKNKAKRVGFAEEPSLRPSIQEDRKFPPGSTTPLHAACREGNVDEVRAILKTGHFDINAADDAGSTPLHIAVRANQVDIVRFLVKKGVHMEIKDSLGETPLEVALRPGFGSIQEILFGGGEEGLRISKLPALLRARHADDNPDFFALVARQSPLYRAPKIQSHLFSGINHGYTPLRSWREKEWDSRSIYLLKWVYSVLYWGEAVRG